MWDDLKIGEGNPQNSAVTLYRVPNGPDISHNHTSFWITHCVLGIGMRIMKNTEEGRELAMLLDSPEPLAIQEHLAKVVFKNADPSLLIRRLTLALEAAYEAGKAAKAAEVRTVLGV